MAAVAKKRDAGSRKAASKPRKVKKSVQTTLFFVEREDCLAACDTLGLSQRKCTDVNRNKPLGYSKTTNHYGHVAKNGGIRRVSINFKLTFDEELYRACTAEQLGTLRHVDSDVGWIVPL